MRVKFAFLLSLLVVLTLAVSAIAQEGHPLTGTWYGGFGAAGAKQAAWNDLTVILNWDGKASGGIINPGPDVIHIKSAVLNSTNWTVHFEADAKNAKSGAMDHYVFDGKMDNVVATNRTISGTWTCGTTKGDFKIQRD